MKTKHTPTPWHVWSEDKGRRDDVYIAGNPTGELGGMRKLAYMVDTWTGANTEANAEFIVRACNAHDQLVTVAKLAKSLTESALSEHGHNPKLVAEAKLALSRIDAALAAAGVA